MLESTVFGAALAFGFRHGFDWDHLAALTDLTGSQQRTRRSLFLATLYALGHATMIMVLGVLAIVFAARVPDAVDSSMERLVGATLVLLGVWLAWTAARHRTVPPMRSRWMVAIDLLRRAVSRLRPQRVVVIEHDHPHDHDHGLHEHSHHSVAPGGHVPTEQPSLVPVATVTTATHSHVHRHVLPAASDPFMRYDVWSSFGIGVLHGIGAETPTQVLLFAAAANVADTATSIGMLACFVVGLVAANTLIALMSAVGFRSVGRSRLVLGALSALTAVSSLVIGALLLAGRSDLLPTLVHP